MHTLVHFPAVVPTDVVLEDVVVTVEEVVLLDVVEVCEGLVVELDTIVTDPVTRPVTVVVEITVVVEVIPAPEITVDGLPDVSVLTTV